MVENLQQKITRYEHFLNEQLRSDLHKVLELRDQVHSDIAEYNQLKTTLKIGNGAGDGSPLKTMVDLGCNFYAQAKVEDCTRIFISIGLGFHLEMTLKEASTFIEEKVTQLTDRADKLAQEAAQINGRIKMMMEALRELQFSSSSQPEPPRREI